MRKIDKALDLATYYKDWIVSLGINPHPKYDSQNEYYKDVVANLLWVQKGLCAYTERFLIDAQRVSPEKWNGGKFNKVEIDGDLDHYDPTRNSDFGWEWSNFFMIDKNTNSSRVKGVKIPNSILKPDSEDYDPFYYLEYDFNDHIYNPKSELDFDYKKKIKHDIDTLGLNYQPIVDFRAKYLTPVILEVQNKRKTIEEASNDLIQFYTAFEMSIKQLNLQEL